MSLANHLILWVFYGLLVPFTVLSYAEKPPIRGLKPLIPSNGGPRFPLIIFSTPSIHTLPLPKNRRLLAQKQPALKFPLGHRPPIKVGYFVDGVDAIKPPTPQLPPIITRIPPPASPPTPRLPPVITRIPPPASPPTPRLPPVITRIPPPASPPTPRLPPVIERPPPTPRLPPIIARPPPVLPPTPPTPRLPPIIVRPPVHQSAPIGHNVRPPPPLAH